MTYTDTIMYVSKRPADLQIEVPCEQHVSEMYNEHVPCKLDFITNSGLKTNARS